MQRPKMDVSIVVYEGGEAVAFENLLRGGPGRQEHDGYVLDLRIDDLVHLQVERGDGREMDVERVEVLVSTPLLNFSRIILPDTGRELVFKDCAVFLRSVSCGVSAAKNGFPFLAFLDQTSEVAAAFGLVSFFRESSCYCVEPKISARKAMVGGADRAVVGFRLPSAGWRYGRTRRITETIFVGERFRSWFHALRRYAEHCKSQSAVCYPDNSAAWEPTWCTWTAWGSNQMSTELILANARIARDLGIGTIIIDDGWFGPGLDEDFSELNLGDYDAEVKKIADLRKAIEQIRTLGLRTLLWYAPTCVAPASRAYHRMSAQLVVHEGAKVMAPNGFYNLCPGSPAVRAYVRAEIKRLLEQYDPDGFKIDLYNTLPVTPCQNGHPHDSPSMVEGVRLLMKDIWETAQKQKSGCLLELKQDYGNVISAQYGTMVRAGDTAYDVDTNLWRCFYAQAYAPVVHNDYLACSAEDSPRAIAIMMIKMLTAGVPTFSLDLLKQPKRTLTIIKAWLDFYARHRRLLRHSREPLTPQLDVWRLGSRQLAIISAVFNAVEIPLPSAPEIWLLNGTGREYFYIRLPKKRESRTDRWTVETFDHGLRPKAKKRLRLSDGARLPVPPGGCLRLGLTQPPNKRTRGRQ